MKVVDLGLGVLGRETTTVGVSCRERAPFFLVDGGSAGDVCALASSPWIDVEGGRLYVARTPSVGCPRWRLSSGSLGRQTISARWRIDAEGSSCGQPWRGYLSAGWGFLVGGYQAKGRCFLWVAKEGISFDRMGFFNCRSSGSAIYSIRFGIVLFFPVLFLFFCGIYSADSFLVFEPFMADLY